MNDSTGIYEEITVEQCISRAKLQLGIKVSDEDEYFEPLVDEAIRELSTLSLYTMQQCEVDIDCNKAKLPKGFVRLLAFWFGTPDCTIWNGVNTALYVNLPYLKLCGCDLTAVGYSPIVGTMQIISGHLWFHNLPSTATTATICYSSLNIDANGEILIYKHYERAIWNYLCAMYSMREGDLNRYNMYNRQWIASKGKVQSIDFQDNFKNTKGQVASSFNAWLGDVRNYI